MGEAEDRKGSEVEGSFGTWTADCLPQPRGSRPVLTYLCILVTARALHLRQRPMVLLPVSVALLFPHQGLLFSLLLLLQHLSHEVSPVHGGSDDFQVVCVDDYFSKIDNRWGLEK